MKLEVETLSDVTIVTVLENRVDAAVAVQFKDAIRDAVCDGPARVILDMGRVMFLDSSGLGAVIGTMKQLGPQRRLELASLTAPVAKVFRLTRMDSIFTIHDSVPPVDGTERSAAHAY